MTISGGQLTDPDGNEVHDYFHQLPAHIVMAIRFSEHDGRNPFLMVAPDTYSLSENLTRLFPKLAFDSSRFETLIILPVPQAVDGPNPTTPVVEGDEYTLNRKDELINELVRTAVGDDVDARPDELAILKDQLTRNVDEWFAQCLKEATGEVRGPESNGSVRPEIDG